MKWDDLKASPQLLDMLERLVASEGWELLESVILEDVQHIQGKLAHAGTSWEDTNRLRGELAATRRWTRESISRKLSDTP